MPQQVANAVRHAQTSHTDATGTAATVVPRCEVKVAVNSALQVQVSSLQMEIAALRASLQMESAADREDATLLFDGLLTVVLSQERSMKARDRAVDNFFDDTLRGSIGISVLANEGTATGIIKVLSTQPVPVYRKKHLDSATGATFSGCCFSQDAPPSDGWWRIGPDEWLFSVLDRRWWICKRTNAELYEAHLKWAFACTNLRSYDSLRALHSCYDQDNVDNRCLEEDDLMSRIASRKTASLDAAPVVVSLSGALADMSDAFVRHTVQASPSGVPAAEAAVERPDDATLSGRLKLFLVSRTLLLTRWMNVVLNTVTSFAITSRTVAS